jgi:outer membrane lipoprotein-sorting protein
MKTALVIVLLTVSHLAFAQKPTGEEVLRNAEQNFHDVKDYTVTLDIVADIERVKVPPMHATMYFKQPEKVHFDSKGFVFLPREGMGVQFGQLTQRYAVDSVGRETADGVVQYRLVLHPRDEKAVIRRMFMWVDGKRWTPERLLIPQADGRAVEAAFTYQQIDRFWLPRELVVSFSTPEKDTTAAAPNTNPFMRSLPAGPRGNTRTGKITVRYSEYRVNTGLSDSLFTSEAQRR